jgi:hypothetical protein
MPGFVTRFSMGTVENGMKETFCHGLSGQTNLDLDTNIGEGFVERKH